MCEYKTSVEFEMHSLNNYPQEWINSWDRSTPSESTKYPTDQVDNLWNCAYNEQRI